MLFAPQKTITMNKRTLTTQVMLLVGEGVSYFGHI